MQCWRLLDTPPMSAAENMALDDALLELRGKGRTPNTIRFLQFKPRCVLVGFHQSVQEEIRVDYCRAHGLDINRRTTGGGAIFFDENQLGWEVFCDKPFFNVTIPNVSLFRTLCLPVISALDMLGLKADFRPRNDIEINGKKISGTGGTESDDAFLFQGTMLVDFDVDTMLKALRIPVEKLKAKEIDSVKDRVTCLRWELGSVPGLEEIKTAVRRGFEQHLGIRLVPDGLMPEEAALFRDKLPHYRSPQWIDQVKPVYQRCESLHAAFKSEAGLVRYTLSLNWRQKQVKEFFITGDFLSYPARALYDLEAELRGAPFDRGLIRGAVRRFFDEKKLCIPGMSFEDFVKPLDQIFQKADIARYGIPLEQCDLINLANGSFADILKQRPSVLLLPYCAKPTGCDLRYRKSCRVCDQEGCTIGPAWSIGSGLNMRIATVVSFEDLWSELMRMKTDGVSAFVGCCCQPFYIKHADDFRRAGVPGILLDINNTTCYELDQAREAYAGGYDKQTSVNLDLLNSVFGALETSQALQQAAQ
jgi:lipoate---protein ligase